jgi:hypothetical protein
VKEGEILYSDYEEFAKNQELIRQRERRIAGIGRHYGY